MEQLITYFHRLLKRYSQFGQMRYLYDEINWEDRLILIRGPKGSGKTTMLMQHIQRTFPDKNKVIYCFTTSIHNYYCTAEIVKQLSSNLKKDN